MNQCKDRERKERLVNIFALAKSLNKLSTAQQAEYCTEFKKQQKSILEHKST